MHEQYNTSAHSHHEIAERSEAAELTVGGTAPVAAPPAPPVATPAVAAPAAPTPAAASPSSAASSGYSVGQQVFERVGAYCITCSVSMAATLGIGLHTAPNLSSGELEGQLWHCQDEAKGMHNGSLFGKSYYSCQDKHGVFCKAVHIR
eukprot:4586160-Amphidinium_carterae.1